MKKTLLFIFISSLVRLFTPSGPLAKPTFKKCCFLLTALFFSISAFAAIDALNFSSPQQEADYHALTQELRCPQCQNNNIADSNAAIAVDMRVKVFELLQEGKSKQDVVQYMVDRYGNFVTYDPPLTVATLALWVAPFALILFGLVWLFGWKKSTPNAAENASSHALSEAQQQRLNALLNRENKQ
ncbi:cytochrome c-type biogenesis protein [Aggregatibacter actinomycetemcomitans]|uniref:cytochrome c-type biogenesis protein n=1 Tax=Aggregatibacter actinomycetemcomitans TaxID=714 RepID=UPI001652A387|nr:cytochrome c-type biogenesis protein [Aggregatibacter actinomycetemcomitans]